MKITSTIAMAFLALGSVSALYGDRHDQCGDNQIPPGEAIFCGVGKTQTEALAEAEQHSTMQCYKYLIKKTVKFSQGPGHWTCEIDLLYR